MYAQVCVYLAISKYYTLKIYTVYAPSLQVHEIAKLSLYNPSLSSTIFHRSLKTIKFPNFSQDSTQASCCSHPTHQNDYPFLLILILTLTPTAVGRLPVTAWHPLKKCLNCFLLLFRLYTYITPTSCYRYGCRKEDAYKKKRIPCKYKPASIVYKKLTRAQNCLAHFLHRVFIAKSAT